MSKDAQNESKRRATLLSTNLQDNPRIRAVAPTVGLKIEETLAELSRLQMAATAAIEHQDELESDVMEESQQQRRDHKGRWAIYKNERYFAQGKIQLPAQLKLLRLDEKLATTHEEQLAQMQAFYGRALEHPAIQAQLAEVGVTRALLEAGKQETDELALVEADVTIAVSQQKQATRDQRTALDELDAFRRKINRLLLLGSDNDPEVRDALGM